MTTLATVAAHATTTAGAAAHATTAAAAKAHGFLSPTGVEIAFLLVGLPFRRQLWYRQRVVVPASCVIAAVGLYWSVQRVFF